MQMVAVIAVVVAFLAGFAALLAEQRRQAQLIPVRIKRNRR